MSRHLNDTEIAAAVAGMELDGDSAEHLGSCLTCRTAVTTMVELLAQRRQAMAGEAPEWQAQHQQIMDSLPAAAVVQGPGRRRWRTALLAAAAAFLLAVGIASLQWRSEPPPAVAEAEVNVEDVLAEVDALLADESIPGLWPADPISDTDELATLFTNGTS